MFVTAMYLKRHHSSIILEGVSNVLDGAQPKKKTGDLKWPLYPLVEGHIAFERVT